MTTAIEHDQAAEKMWAYLFLTMPDHLHALLSFPPAFRMEAVLRDWKRYVAKQAGIVWQNGFFERRLRTNKSLEKNAAYIRLNPVRAGLASHAEMWNFVWLYCHAVPAR